MANGIVTVFDCPKCKREYTENDSSACPHILVSENRQIDALISGCEAALAWVRNMKIVPGGERDRLRMKLEQALRVAGKGP